jgi:iron complex outermembrane recepter protein
METTFRYAAEQDRVDKDLNEDQTPGWGVIDLKAGTSWQKWSLVAGINNILDKHYYNHLSFLRDPFASGVKVAEPGLIAFVNLRYQF